jgi:ABC-type Zn uptake system ZnuABC Zn-binding protein ZnuA
VVALLAACSASPAGSGAGGQIAVVATTTQVGSIVDEIGGDDVALTVLLRPGVEAHDFEMTPAAGAAVEEADLILKSGAGLEEWLDQALETIGGADRVRDLGDGIELRELEGSVDPHYWLSAPSAIVMVENARDALVGASPSAADAIEGRAVELVARLEAADLEIRRLMDEIPEERRTIVTDHDALGYFLDEYGLTFGGSVFPSLDVTAEPSASEIEQLVGAIREAGIRAIFTESAVDPRLARAVADETDAELVAEPLYTDSLGPPGSGADTLDGMLLHNARVIHGALVDG